MFYPLEIRPLGRSPFEASFSVEQIGPLGMAKAFSQPATIERTSGHIDERVRRRVTLLMPVSGRLRVSHYGQDSSLEEHDLILTDSFMPSRTSFEEPNASLIAVMPYQALLRHLPNPESVFGRPVSGRHGFGQLVGTMLQAIWTQVEQGLPTQHGAALVQSLCGVVATAFAAGGSADASESVVSMTRRAQIKRYIERNLNDTELNANSVAKGLGLSPRYTRMVFAAEAESIPDYIMRRRLEECANQLASDGWRQRSITETAVAWGFSSMAHFARAFKERFSVTPSEYRRARSR